MADSMITKLFSAAMYPGKGGSPPSTSTSTSGSADKVAETKPHSTSLMTGPTDYPANHWTRTKTYIVIVSVLGGVLITALTLLAVFLIRRQRRRQAYAKVGLKQENMDEKDVFNAEMHESDALHPQGAVRERNYENGYDNVETQYDGRDYDPERSRGDNRAKM